MIYISVISPVFNARQYITDCIENVISQGCQGGIEHIIVDGGSSDGTVEIIKQYAEKYVHIRWVSEKDQGQSDAMNKGIRMAKGQFISFLNADDFYEPHTLQTICEIISHEKLPEPSLIVGNCNIWNEQGLIQVNNPGELSLFNIFLDKPVFPNNPSAYFYHKSLHSKIGYYEVDNVYNMDWEFIIRALASGYLYIKYVNKVLGNWRKIEGTKTVTDEKNGEGKTRRIKILYRFYKHLTLTQRLYLKHWYIKNITPSNVYLPLFMHYLKLSPKLIKSNSLKAWRAFTHK